MGLRDTHPNFVPNATMGNRKETAVLLVGTAKEFEIPQREIASARNGFYISDRLADVLYAEADDEADDEDTVDEMEVEPEIPRVSGNGATNATTDKAKKTTKTSGNRAGKNEQE